MKKNNGNIISILLIFLGIISMVTSVHAHSGKTDSNEDIGIIKIKVA